MKRTSSISRLQWFLVVLAVAVGLILSVASGRGRVSSPAMKREAAGANLGHHISLSKLSSGAGRLHDTSSTGVLISKADNDDLLFRDATGKERFIAREVIAAKFSPDGHKIAYATRDREVFVETLVGELLAQIPRAFDPVWGNDSMTLSFSAIPSADYPELQQTTVYDLTSGRAADARIGN